MAFYTRLFGPDFQDPNAKEFKPNPKIMVRQSVISSVLDDTKTLASKVGAEDKARLDQYFSGLRHLEQQFDQQLTKPDPIAACVAPKAVTSEPELGGAASATLLSQLRDLAVVPRLDDLMSTLRNVPIR